MALGFGKQIERWVKRTEKKLERTIELFLVDFTNALIGRTPVGDPTLWQSPPPPDYVPGTLINSWYTTLDRPTNAGVRIQNTSGADAIANARDVAGRAAGKVVYISNPTPYANRIEYDAWSTQAPAGMARITAVEFKPRLEKAARRKR